MSAPVAGKFQDHYVVLGVEGKADAETIKAAYAKLAASHSDPEKLESLAVAFEVLSDPVLRASFDRLKGGGAETKPHFSGLAFFEALKNGAALRAAILCVLYDRRRINPFSPSLSMRHLEGMLQASMEELNFALWYLKQRTLVMNDDKSSLQITVDGMDQLERNPPSPEQVMQFFKSDDAAEPKRSVLTALHHAVKGRPAVETPDPVRR